MGENQAGIRVERNLSDIETVRRIAEASATTHHAAAKANHGRLRLVLRTGVTDFHGETAGFALVRHLDGELSAGAGAAVCADADAAGCQRT